ncbi:MAG: hypothetical protein JWP23_1081 [Phenylobacterium sp.]|nr:hypothetical protein [Phenylobacterium sp.]
MSTPARDQVLALVCGLPSRERWARQIVVLQAYIDDSRSRDGTIILAGYIANVQQWLAFTDEWDELLTMAPKMDAFKMSGLMLGGGDQSFERAMFHYRVIERHVQASVSCVLDVPAYKAAVAALELPEPLDNPYYWVWLGLMDCCIHFQETMKIREPIDFIFDEQSEGDIALDTFWPQYAESLRANKPHLVGERPIFRNDMKFKPLQAADLLAWWMRKNYEDGRFHTDGSPFPWPLERDLPRLQIEIGETAIRKQLTRLLVTNIAHERGVEPHPHTPRPLSVKIEKGRREP